MRRRTVPASLGPLLAAALAGSASAQAGSADTSSAAAPADLPPLALEAAFAADLYAPAVGEAEGKLEYLDNLDLLATLDLAALLGARRTLFRVHVQSNRGGSISARVGDLQGLSNIEAPSTWRLYEIWLEHNLWPGHLSLLAGIQDVNAEFDVIPAAADFLNSSFGIGPEYSGSGLSGPSTFPFTTLGVRAMGHVVPEVYVALSVHDGAPGVPSMPDRSRYALREGALISWEAGYARPLAGAPTGPGAAGERRRIGRGRSAGRMLTRVAAGGWRYTRRFETWGEDGSGRSRGLYALAERRIAGGRLGSGLSAFARAGVAEPSVNRIGAYLGGGLVLCGVGDARPGDAIGLGIAHARNSSDFLDAASEPASLARAETVVELYYRRTVTGGFQLQPDVQWILNPGSDAEAPDAWVFGLRGIASFAWP